MIKCSRFLVLISFTEHLEYFGHLEQSILAISRMCKLRKILNHDRLSSLKFIVRDISATIFHYKMFPHSTSRFSQISDTDPCWFSMRF